MELPHKPVVLIGDRNTVGGTTETRIGRLLTGEFGKTYHLADLEIPGALLQPHYASGINQLVVDKDHLKNVVDFKRLNPRIRAYVVAASPDEIPPEDQKLLAGIITPPVITQTMDDIRAPDGGFRVVRFTTPAPR